MPSGKARHHSFVGKRPHVWGRSRYKQLQERREEFRRDMKRKMLEQGVIENKTPFYWEWRYDGKFGSVASFTRSEARSKIKQILNIPKKGSLPQGVQIQKVKFDEFTT